MILSGKSTKSSPMTAASICQIPRSHKPRYKVSLHVFPLKPSQKNRFSGVDTTVDAKATMILVVMASNKCDIFPLRIRIPTIAPTATLVTL